MSEEMKWDMVFSYTRAQAIEDGVLVDITGYAQEAGFKIPVALTAAVWGIIGTIPPEWKGLQDLKGRLWDVLTVAAFAAREKPTESTVLFKVELITRKGKETIDFKMICGPGDDAEPVLTIMLPEED